MASRARMFRGVSVGRVVATEGGTTVLAGAEVDPSRTTFHALLALTSLGLLDPIDGVDVSAAVIRHGSSSVLGPHDVFRMLPSLNCHLAGAFDPQ